MSRTDADVPTSFWRRQFSLEATTEQRGFDITFGIIFPIICLLFDPIVFRTTFNRPMLAAHLALGGVSIGFGLLSLIFWLTTDKPSAVLAGMLFGGALVALAVGLVLLPFSIIGLAILIGFLGLVPFFTAFVFWRSAYRAYRRSQSRNGTRIFFAILGLLIACGVPISADMYVSRETARGIRMLTAEDPTIVEQGLAVLMRISFFVDADELATVYSEEKDEGRRETLARAYGKLTGESISRRLAVLDD